MKVEITDMTKFLLWAMAGVGMIDLAMYQTDKFIIGLLTVYGFIFLTIAITDSWQGIKGWMFPANYLNINSNAESIDTSDRMRIKP